MRKTVVLLAFKLCRKKSINLLTLCSLMFRKKKQKEASYLYAFSNYPVQTQLCNDAFGKTIATPQVYFTRSSRTRDKALFFFILSVHRDRTVSRRSKPSSCTALIGEQPNPWNLFQLQDAISRHRGAKQSHRQEL